MGTIVLHAGMPKAGSSSVQRWLERSAKRLRSERDVDVRVVKSAGRTRGRGTAEHLELLAYPVRGIGVNSGDLVRALSGATHPREVVESWVGDLDRAATGSSTVVLSSEALARPFWQGDEDVLGPLDELGARHRVRVAYYVRPQEESLEAAWRQWGFRDGTTPSAYVLERAEQLHYARTIDLVGELAPRLELEVRPFRPDLLTAGDVVVDFAATFLDVSVPEGAPRWANRGLPLELVNVLATLPPEVLQRHERNRLLEEVKRIVGPVDLAETPAIRRSRDVLRSWCRATFEDGNRRMIDELGWETDHFVSAPEEPGRIDDADIAELDTLWRPQASAAELHLLQVAIAHATAKRRGGLTRRMRRFRRRVGRARRAVRAPLRRLGRRRPARGA